MDIITLTEEVQRAELRIIEANYSRRRKEIEELSFDNIYDLCVSHPFMLHRYPELREEFIKKHIIDFNYNKYYDKREITVNKTKEISENDLLNLIKGSLIKNFSLNKYPSDYYISFEIDDNGYEIYHYNCEY